MFVFFGEVIEAVLKFLVYLFDLSGALVTMTEFFCISALAASRFLLSFY